MSFRGERDTPVSARFGCLSLIATLAIGPALDYGAGQWADHTYGATNATKYVEESGYKDPVLQEVEHFAVGLRGCPPEAEAAYVFGAIALNGERVDVEVCRAFFQGAVIHQG
jgi:hypothetical protein